MHFSWRLAEPRRRSGIALLLAFIFYWILAIFFPTVIESLEEQSSDWIWRLTAADHAEQRVVIIDIDENSQERFGAWPWPRSRMEELSNRLKDEGASLQIYDVFFPVPDSGDKRLAAALGRNQSVIAEVLAIRGGETQQGRLAGAWHWPACPALFPVANYYLANSAAFSELPAGHITPQLSNDGSIRSQPAVICHDGRPYPALFLAAAQLGSGGGRIELATGSGLFGAPWELRGLPFSARGIPLDNKGNVRIPWLVRPDAFISISASDVLEGRVPAAMLENAWVVIGSTALGVNDRVATPFSNQGAGVMIHAELLIGALDGRIPGTPRLGRALEALAALLAIALVYTLARSGRNQVYRLLLGAALSAVILFALKAALLAWASLWLHWMPPTLLVVGFALNLSALEYAWSRRERDRIYSHLASYLPRPVAAALAERDPSGAIDAARAHIVAMYADIRNFSAYCEMRPPEETTAVLHAFISAATDIVEQHGGEIESIQGDAILAVWQVRPEGHGDELDSIAKAALVAGVELVRRSHELFPALQEEHLEGLVLGVGMESGPATVGSFGPARRRTHLAMGRAVTLAVRLEQMTGELAHPLLIGENLAAYLGSHQLESQGVFLLEGIVAPSHIYAYPLKNCVA